MSTSIDIRVKKANKIYHEGDSITGTIVIQTPGEIKHEGITLTMEGLVELQLSPRNVGIFEAFYNSVKPVQICHVVVEISGPGKIPSGKTDIPFEVPLLPRGNKTIYETYHGVFVYIQYTLKCDLKRGFLAKGLMKMAEFIVEYKASSCTKAVSKKVDFVITPESLEGPRDLGTIPRFKISGIIDSVVCCINKPFTGQIKIEHTEIPIKSIELQLVRVETCGCAEGYAKDVTEIQSIQIGEEFEINVVVVFENDHLVSENFPIVLTRA